MGNVGGVRQIKAVDLLQQIERSRPGFRRRGYRMVTAQILWASVSSLRKEPKGPLMRQGRYLDAWAGEIVPRRLPWLLQRVKRMNDGSHVLDGGLSRFLGVVLLDGLRNRPLKANAILFYVRKLD
jgi:hypothetical protein